MGAGGCSGFKASEQELSILHTLLFENSIFIYGFVSFPMFLLLLSVYAALDFPIIMTESVGGIAVFLSKGFLLIIQPC